MTLITPHFTLEEMTKTSTNYKNTPTIEATINLCFLCEYVLEPLREHIKRPIVINSGFRSEAVNKAGGGVYNSRHLYGCAADIQVVSEYDAAVKFQFLSKLRCIDELLFERSRKTGARWLHVAWSREPRFHINYNYIV